jgi:hypothetical protein
MQTVTRHWPVVAALVGVAATVLAVGVFVSTPDIWSYDAVIMRQVAQSMVTEHSLRVHDDPYGLNTPYASYGLGMPLLMAVGEYLGPHLGRPASDLEVLVNPVLLAMTAVVVALSARAGGAGPRLAAAAALVVCLATPLLPYAATEFSEPGTALGVALALLGVTLVARRPLAAGMTLGAGVGLTAMMRFDSLLLVAPVVGLALLVQARRRWLLAVLGAAAGAAPGLAVVVAYNEIRYGSPLQTTYQGLPAGTAWSHPFWPGFTGLLVSPGRGLLVYAPVVLVVVLCWRPVWRRSPVLALACAALVVDRLVVYPFWHAWPGGVTWGPRFLVPALPAVAPFVVAALRFMARTRPSRTAWRPALGAAGLLVLIAVSLGVQVVGALTSSEGDRLHTAIGQRTTWSGQGSYGEFATSPAVMAAWDSAIMDWSLFPVTDHTRRLLHGQGVSSRFLAPVHPGMLVGLAAVALVGLAPVFFRPYGRRTDAPAATVTPAA